jgi:hypothetical protein
LCRVSISFEIADCQNERNPDRQAQQRCEQKLGHPLRVSNCNILGELQSDKRYAQRRNEKNYRPLVVGKHV